MIESSILISQFVKRYFFLYFKSLFLIHEIAKTQFHVFLLKFELFLTFIFVTECTLTYQSRGTKMVDENIYISNASVLFVRCASR